MLPSATSVPRAKRARPSARAFRLASLAGGALGSTCAATLPLEIQKRHAFMRSSQAVLLSSSTMAGAPIVASTSDSHASTALVGSTSGDVSVGMTTSDAHIICSTTATTRSSVCDIWRKLRKRGNAYGRMDLCCANAERKVWTRRCAHSAFGDGGSGGDDEPGRSAHLIEILEVGNASAGYCQARTTSPSGETFFQNAAFEMHVLSLDAVIKAYKRNDAELISLIVHQEDLATYMR